MDSSSRKYNNDNSGALRLAMSSSQEKFNLRWRSPEQEQAIRRAAEVKQKSVSAFILDHAYEAAQQILHDQDRYHFTLNEEDWKQFSDALDAPTVPAEGLKELMNTPSVFEKNA
jgi:uncharacterized protein (DUF1778 family)